MVYPADIEFENYESVLWDEPQTKDYTVKDIFEALKQNGFEHLRGEWFSGAPGAIGACVLGQAALNLNAVDKNNPDEDSQGDMHTIYGQLNRFRTPNEKWVKPLLIDDTYSVEIGLGELIVAWNDKYSVKNDKLVYALPTYQDVVDMAYEVMAPFFDEKVTLVHYEY